MSQEGLGQRFGHLLQPIRDLADNWSIDVAKDLEEYLEILEGITFTFDDGGKALNFAQAALLIQGSACVYSKKVEYLYNLVFQALEFITTRKRAKEDGTATDGADKEQQQDDAEDDQDAAFLALDDLPTATNIDLEDIKKERGERSLAFAPILRPMVSLVSMSIGSDGAPCPGGGSDFQMASCIVHRNGALVLESAQCNDDWLGLGALLNPKPPQQLPRRSMAPISGISPQDLLRLAAAEPAVGGSGDMQLTAKVADAPKPTEQGGFGEVDIKELGSGVEGLNVGIGSGDGIGIPDGGGFDSDDGGDAAGDALDGQLQDVVLVDRRFTEAASFEPAPLPDLSAMEEPPQSPPRHTMTLRQRRQSRRTTIHGKDIDVILEEWSLLDPHDASAAPPKPFRRGKTFRVPKSLFATSIPSRAKKDTEEPAVAAVRVRAPYFEEFDELYEAEMKRRRAALASRRRPAQTIRVIDDRQLLPAGVQADAVEDHPGEEVFFEQPYAVVPEGEIELDYAPPAAEDSDGDINDGVCDGTDGNNVLRSDGVGTCAFSDALQTVIAESGSLAVSNVHDDTFEEPVLAAVDDKQRAAERYKLEMELTSRISEWHTRLEPIIEEQEARRGFDIQESAIEILDKLGGSEDGDGEQLHISADETVQFSELMKGKRPWEVCRYFLSSLLLVNCGNIAIASKEPLKFTLKTTEHRFDACNVFEAQQQQPQQEKAASNPPAAPPKAGGNVSDGESESDVSEDDKKKAKRDKKSHKGKEKAPKR